MNWGDATWLRRPTRVPGVGAEHGVGFAVPTAGGSNGVVALLAVEDVRVEFGGIVALADLSFTIDEGQICALIGPNGAGKTTLFNCVSRLYQPTAGRITFAGRTCSPFPRTASRKLGIARTFQNLALFPALTVVENVMVGAAFARRLDADPPARRARDPRAPVAERVREPSGRRTAVRHAEAHRDRARARRAPAAASARRTRRRAHPLRGRRARRARARRSATSSS